MVGPAAAVEWRRAPVEIVAEGPCAEAEAPQVVDLHPRLRSTCRREEAAHDLGRVQCEESLRHEAMPFMRRPLAALDERDLRQKSVPMTRDVIQIHIVARADIRESHDAHALLRWRWRRAAL